MRTIALVSLLLAAGCDKATQPDTKGPEPQYRIADLKSLCDGRASVRVTRQIAVRGFVTANDLYGEFPSTIVLEDDSGGISIAAEHPSLADDYPVGIVATVQCNGLTLCDYGGKIVLGTTPGPYGAGRIPREELPRYIRTELPDGAPPQAVPLSFDAVTARHIDTRVRFDGVRFTEAGTWCDTDPETGRTITTERTIEDDRGRTFTVRTASTCVYAKEPVPSGTGSLYGIIDYFGGKYSLRVTNREAVFSYPTASPHLRLTERHPAAGAAPSGGGESPAR